MNTVSQFSSPKTRAVFQMADAAVQSTVTARDACQQGFGHGKGPDKIRDFSHQRAQQSAYQDQ